ncbi:metallophosphoesterase family protein [bacterium]|nr:metallophosphoesterase family protein [bacterium]
MKKNRSIAIISDIHGNTPAFTAVLADIKQREIDTIINLGDSLYGPLDPKGTFDLLIENELVSISGNEDRLILENLESKSDSFTTEYVKIQIDFNVVDWLRSLSFDMVFENLIYCCHASPQCDVTYLLENLQPGHVAIKDEIEIEEVLKDIPQHIVVCGHSHVSKIVEIGDRLILNAGSVGLPAYDDELPIPHKMENFDPRARYTILKFNGDITNIEQISVAYDHEEAARMAEKNNRNDWAGWIRTGRV